MEFSNFEKRLLLVCLRFLYKAGPSYVSMLWEGSEPPKQEAWGECKKRIKVLYKRIKESIDDGNVPEPEACRSHHIEQRRLSLRLHRKP